MAFIKEITAIFTNLKNNEEFETEYSVEFFEV